MVANKLLEKAHSSLKQRMTSKSPWAYIEFIKEVDCGENRHWHWYPCCWCTDAATRYLLKIVQSRILIFQENCQIVEPTPNKTNTAHCNLYFLQNNCPGLRVGMYRSLCVSSSSDLTAENWENSGSLTPPPFYRLIRLHSMAAANSLFSLSTALQAGRWNEEPVAFLHDATIVSLTIEIWNATK